LHEDKTCIILETELLFQHPDCR